MKQTAVEWLLKEFQEAHKDFGGLDLEWLKRFEQAKEMEKEQVVEKEDLNHEINIETILKVLWAIKDKDQFYFVNYGKELFDNLIKQKALQEKRFN